MNHDDPMLEALLERLPIDPELWRLGSLAQGPEEERECRAWVELVGLVGCSCAEDAPAGARNRLLAAVGTRVDAPEPTRQAGGAEVVSLAQHRAVGPVAEPVVRSGASRRALWALAAALTSCVLGLAYLGGRVVEQRRVLESFAAPATASAPVAAVAETPSAVTAGVIGTEESEEIQRLRQRLRMVTSVARYAYPLHRPASTGPASTERVSTGLDAGGEPGGVIYVCGAHQQWYLALNGLEPAPRGQEYRLWFLTEDGPQGGEPLRVDPGKPVELEASTLPRGTRGFAVTLEPSGRAAANEPQGTMILLAEESVSL